ncbi:hypothetical protein HK105_205847 [Polyrhizophydium stewartii]|uniref:Protein kinase domain-containing protein n=1 Tax=Polyrhizophydium stewartii TaxID=2732419 RepID=A0ABR4N583_9FUNG
MNQFLEKYDLQHTIGTGAFSEVKLAVERATGQKFAIKIIDKLKCKGKESMIETEVNILKRVRHPNIIQLYEMYEFSGKIYLVMELVTGGELFDEIVGRGKYTERDASKIVQRILCAIEYLHSMAIVHRDLKPENLLLSDKTRNAKIMISDFGLSKFFNDDEVMKTACGTPGYVAPEVLRRQGYRNEVDLWSLGVITYILLCGYPPFFDPNNVELFRKIMAGKYEFDSPWWDNVSEKGKMLAQPRILLHLTKDFVRKLLVLDPNERYTAAAALRHPFIVDYNNGPMDPMWQQDPVIVTAAQAGVQSLVLPAPSSASTAAGASAAHQVQPMHCDPPANQPQAQAQHHRKVPSGAPSIPAPVHHRAEQPAPMPSSASVASRNQSQRVPEPRPLAAKSPLDDSGTVTSNEGIAPCGSMGHGHAAGGHHSKEGRNGSYFSSKVHRITSWFRTGVAIQPSSKSSHRNEKHG